MSSSSTSQLGSHSGGLGSLTRTKRSISGAFKEVFVAANPDQIALFKLVDSLDFTLSTDSDEDAVAANHLLELVVIGDLGHGRPFVLPAQLPEGKETWNLSFVGGSEFAVFLLEADFTNNGGNFLARHIGGDAEGVTIFDGCKGLALPTAPTKFLVTRPAESGVKTELEIMIAAALARTVDVGTDNSTPLVAPTSGGSSTGGVVVRKMAEVYQQTLSLDTVRMSSKIDAYKKVMILAAPLREMTPTLIARLCPDYVFEVDLVREECLRLKDRVLTDSDPCFGLTRMRGVMDLAVWQDKEKFSVWFKGNHRLGDWTHSLWDFRGTESSGWGPDGDYQGRMNLLRAVEAWGDFQRVFKGEAFYKCTAPFRDLWESAHKYMENYHNVYIQFQIENMIRDYFHELCFTRGTDCVSIPGQRLGGQMESVSLLQKMVADLVVVAKSGQWEQAPHEKFYRATSTYSNIANKPGMSTPKRSLSVATTPTAAREEKGDRAWVEKPPPCHRHGLCLWHLAGGLGLKNRANTVYSCDEQETHMELSKVPIGTVRKLLTDTQFMGVCRSAELKKRVVKAVDEQKALFRK